MKSRTAFLLIYGLVLGLACITRLLNLDTRPMHGDEAVHAIKFGSLLEQGSYTYDPDEYHGPTLNYLSLIPAWLSGASMLTEIDEQHLRVVPALCGIATIMMLLLVCQAAGWEATVLSALLVAISPAMVFYSRYYIQEMLLVCFAFGLIVSCFRYLHAPHLLWAIFAGIFLGLMHATKETFVIYLASIFVAAAFSWQHSKTSPGEIIKRFPKAIRLHIVAALVAAFLVSILFFSSLFSNPHGIIDSITTFNAYFSRASIDGQHIHPWFTYLQWLFFFKQGPDVTFAETAILPFAIAGIMLLFFSKNPISSFWYFMAVYSITQLIIFSIIPYKTPWNAIGALHGLLLIAGFGMHGIYQKLTSKHAKFAWGLISALAITYLGWTSRQINGRHVVDAQHNPYLYAHPTMDIFAISERIHAFALQSEDSTNVYIQVAASGSDYWPLPWYLRDLPNIGWWDHLDETVPTAPIAIISPDLEKNLTKRLYELPPPGQRPLYVPFFEKQWWLRPGITLNGYATKEIWDRFYQTTQEIK